MKYFENITTQEELKKEFRTLSIQLHPDRGGNADEFKAMKEQYDAACKSIEQAAEREQAEAEYRKAAEEKRRQEEEEERKAAEKMRPIVAQWAKVLKRVPAQGDKKAAYLAAVKHNIKAVFAKYFPGVKVSVSICNKAWMESVTIKWTDGPSEAQVENIPEFGYFISTMYVHDNPYDDYGSYVEIKSNKEWRKAFGEVSATRFGFEREFSQLGRAEVLAKIADVLPQFAGITNNDDTAKIEDDDNLKLYNFFKDNLLRAGISESKIEACRRECTQHFYGRYKRGYGVSLSEVVYFFREFYAISEETAKAVADAENAPKFTPRHNKTYNAVLKALGRYSFCLEERKEGERYYNSTAALTPLEAAEVLAASEPGKMVCLAEIGESDGKQTFYTISSGGRTVQAKRNAKFENVGFSIFFSYGFVHAANRVSFERVSPEVLAELRKDAESVEQQRKEWEEAQKNGTAAASATPATSATDETAPADGLQLVEIAGGVAVVGDSRTTYRNRKQIKAHGAKWNKEAQQWQATTPEGVEALREWFGAPRTGMTNEETTNEDKSAPAVVSTTTEEETITTTNEEKQEETMNSKNQQGTTPAARGRVKNAPETLAKLQAVAEEVELLTEDNAHTAAAIAQVQALLGVGMNVSPLIEQLKIIAFMQDECGGLLPEESERRYSIAQEAKNRAAFYLTAEEFRALYGYTPEKPATAETSTETAAEDVRPSSDDKTETPEGAADSVTILVNKEVKDLYKFLNLKDPRDIAHVVCLDVESACLVATDGKRIAIKPVKIVSKNGDYPLCCFIDGKAFKQMSAEMKGKGEYSITLEAHKESGYACSYRYDAFFNGVKTSSTSIERYPDWTKFYYKNSKKLALHFSKDTDFVKLVRRCLADNKDAECDCATLAGVSGESFAYLTYNSTTYRLHLSAPLQCRFQFGISPKVLESFLAAAYIDTFYLAPNFNNPLMATGKEGSLYGFMPVFIKDGGTIEGCPVHSRDFYQHTGITRDADLLANLFKTAEELNTPAKTSAA